MATVDLSTLPVKPTSFGRWQQLNGPLGLQAFGMNAIVCDPGEEFDIAHDESETGHQEAYVVVSGRAVFTIGDDRIEAGPGTVVSAPDPAANRAYEALEPAPASSASARRRAQAAERTVSGSTRTSRGTPQGRLSRSGDLGAEARARISAEAAITGRGRPRSGRAGSGRPTRRRRGRPPRRGRR